MICYASCLSKCKNPAFCTLGGLRRGVALPAFDKRTPRIYHVYHTFGHVYVTRRDRVYC